MIVWGSSSHRDHHCNVTPTALLADNAGPALRRPPLSSLLKAAVCTHACVFAQSVNKKPGGGTDE